MNKKLENQTLYDALAELREPSGNQNINNYLRTIAPQIVPKDYSFGDDMSAVQSFVLKLFDNAMAELLIAPLSKPIKDRQIEIFNRNHTAFFRSINQIDTEKFFGNLKIHAVLERQQNLLDILNTSALPDSTPIDRPEFLKDSLELLQKIEVSDAKRMVKDFAKLSISSLNRMITESSGITDEEIRRHALSIYGNFLTEFEDLTKEDRKVIDDVKTWARRLGHVSLFGIALIADSSAVFELIEDQFADQKLIEHHVDPEKQATED